MTANSGTPFADSLRGGFCLSSVHNDELVSSTIVGRFPSQSEKGTGLTTHVWRAQRSPLSANGPSEGVCPLPSGDEGVSTRPAFWHAVLGWSVPTPPSFRRSGHTTHPLSHFAHLSARMNRLHCWFTPAEHPDEKYYIFGRDGGAGEPAALGSSPDALAFMTLAGKIAG